MNIRLIAGAGGTITLTVYDAEGNPAAAPTTPTVTVVDGAGVTVATGAANNPSTGVYELGVTGAQLAQCDVYTVTWDADTAVFTTQVEAIGGWPITLAAMRAANSELADTVRYPASLLEAARDAAMTRMEQACRVAWSTRRARVTLSGDGSALLVLPHTAVQDVLAITLDGVAVTVADCTVWDWGGVAAPIGSRWSAGMKNVTVDYLHGVQFAPSPVADAILELAIGAVVAHGGRVPERATSVSTELGTFRLTLPGRDGPTGIPSVDAVIAQFGHTGPVVG